MTKIFILFAILLLSAHTTDATMCACCVEKGYFGASTERPDAARVALFDEMKFAPGASLYMTAAGFDGVKGLEPLADELVGDEEDFNIGEMFAARSWTLRFTTRSGKSGTLTLPMPPRMDVLKIDTRDEEFRDRGLGVSLYKQFSFTGRVRTGTGIFRTATLSPTTYTLMFQGRGNGCDNASDFGHWRLELTGSRARFAILGKLNGEQALDSRPTKAHYQTNKSW